MQYLGINPKSPPSDQYFHSKIPYANITKGGWEGGGRFRRFNTQLKRNCKFDKIIVKTTLIPWFEWNIINQRLQMKLVLLALMKLAIKQLSEE